MLMKGTNSKGKSVRSVEQIRRRKFCWRSVFRIFLIFFSFGFVVKKKLFCIKNISFSSNNF
jgi:hypothetical protein